MKEQLPAPAFNSGDYERPQKKWTCGWIGEGMTCRLGPDAAGRCRAAAECTPLLECKPGETKGRYRCTRPKELGGPCAEGPLPNGQCARVIPKCQPIRTLRSRRGLVVRLTIAATVGLLLVLLFGDGRHRFINPGALSAQHRSVAFAQLASELPGGEADADNCAACHDSARKGSAEWLQAAFLASPGPLEVHRSLTPRGTEMTAIDENCQKCHPAHNFHQPNVLREHSCSLCHVEHKGSGPMKAPADAQCISCHGSAEVMAASARKGSALPAHAFDFRPTFGRHLFAAPRPEEGYTTVLTSFEKDHPEFQVVREKLREPNTLRFNHERHFQSDIPRLNGKSLSCADCHQREASGSYHQPITFEKNCQACHSLHFDPATPELEVPHGKAENVRAFLRSLPSQYAQVGRQKGLRGDELEAFSREKMTRLREWVRAGENLEEQVFFNSDRWGPAPANSQVAAQGRARYPGCAFCHEVEKDRGGLQQVAAPVIPDRWMVRGSFDHSRHLQVECSRCHQVTRSRDTADILLPGKKACLECHSSAGGVRHDCATCHSFHNFRKQPAVLSQP